MKELSFWLNANRIALNVPETEVILFKTKHKPCDTDLRLKLCRKRLYKTKYLRYLGIKIDENLNWKIHIHDLASKLNRANAVLAKLRHFVNGEILRSTYFAMFHSHLNYESARNGLLFVPSYNTVRFGRKSVIHSTTLTWNYLQDKLTKYNFLGLTPRSLKILLVKLFISEYNSQVKVQ